MDHLNKDRQIHFIGIGGAGMSGIAKVLLEMGFKVSGSDLKESRYTKTLIDLGADIKIGHDPDNLGQAQLAVISSAIPDYNKELKAARERNLQILARARMLAEICRLNPKAIAVAGTHGKTTTTSMTALILKKAGLDPTFLIGGELNDIGSNAKHGTGRICVVEADESDGSLVHLEPTCSVVTNIDSDHLDYHESLEKLVELFSAWLSNLPPDGLAITLGDGSVAQRAAEAAGCAFTTFGSGRENDLAYREAVFSEFGSEFEVTDRVAGKSYRLTLRVPGEHNILNALAALAAAKYAGVDLGQAGELLASFTGAKRRFQLIGEGKQVTIVDDYAHHPTEVIATLKAARGFGRRRVICVFQPHRFSRTKLLAGQFGEAFAHADLTVMTDIYGAGEQPMPGVSGKLLVDQILSAKPGSQIVYLPNKLDVQDYLISNVRPGDMVLTMGAGDIWSVGHDLFNHLIDFTSNDAHASKP